MVDLALHFIGVDRLDDLVELSAGVAHDLAVGAHHFERSGLVCVARFLRAMPVE